jgi:hypothetical protein
LAGTERAELLPDRERDQLTCRKVDRGGKGARGSKVERADQGDQRVQQRDNIGPRIVSVTGWFVTRLKENLISKNEGAVCRVSGVTMPLVPPAGTGVTGGAVVRVAAVKVDAEVSTGAAVCRCGVSKTRFKVTRLGVPSVNIKAS